MQTDAVKLDVKQAVLVCEMLPQALGETVALEQNVEEAQEVVVAVAVEMSEALPDSEGVVVTLGVREALPLMVNEPVREGCAVAHDVEEGKKDALSVTD